MSAGTAKTQVRAEANQKPGHGQRGQALRKRDGSQSENRRGEYEPEQKGDSPAFLTEHASDGILEDAADSSNFTVQQQERSRARSNEHSAQH